MLKTVLNRSMVFWIAALVILIDQVIKYQVRANIPVGGTWVPVEGWAPIFQFLHIENTGAAFGMFQAGGLIFTVVAIVVSIVITFYALRLPEGQWGLRFALGLQLGGAIGNLIDRLVNGPVTDFINLLGAFNTPIFNIADLSITTGVIVLLWLMWRESREAAAAPAAAPPDEPASAGPGPA